MPTYQIHPGRGAVIPLSPAKGKSLHSIEVYQDEEALRLDLQFRSGLSLELSFRVGLSCRPHCFDM